MLRDQLLPARSVEDDDGVEPIARGAPFVLLHVPGRHGGNGAAVVEDGREFIDEALGEGRHRPDILQAGQAVADPHLHGAEVAYGPDVPPDLAHGIDHPGGEHVLDVGLVGGPVRELERQPCRGKLLEHERPL